MSAPPSGSAQAVLNRLGWTLRPRSAGGGRLEVVRQRDGRVLAVLALEGGGKTITPVRLRANAGAGPATAAEQAGLDELVGALTFMMESRLGRADLPQPWALAENHSDWSGLNGPGAEELILRTTYACSQRCRFCFIPSRGAVPRSEVEAELDRLAGRRNRRGELTLSGGEPTADPRLPSILESARRRGFRRFIIQTNAVFLARPGAVERLVALGTESFLVSLHSHRPESYDLITGSKGQFKLAAAGLRRLIHCGDPAVSVTVNVVVNAWNCAELPELMGFLGGLSAGASAPRVFFSVINEAGHDLAPEAAVDFARAAPHLRAAVARCARAGLEVERFAGESAFPLCLVSAADRSRLAARRPLPQDRVRYAESADGDDAAVGRLKRPACKGCAFDARCLGVAATYARRFGLAALEVPA